MRLADVGAVIRPREPWEAVDQGFAMLGRWRGPAVRAWLVTVVPLVIGLYVAGWEHPMLAVAVIWWLKPLYDRVPLFVLSRALFGGDVRLLAVLRELPRWLARGLLFDLTLRRFAGARTLYLPVTVLERSRGRTAVQRERVLREDGSGRTAFGLAVACLHLEWSIALGLIGLGWMLAPEGTLPDLTDVLVQIGDGALGPQVTRLLSGTWLVGMLVCEPLYVAGGFALYINRRTVLEGWDVELAFRRLAGRVRAEARASAGSETRKGTGSAGRTGTRAGAWLLAAALALGALAGDLRAGAPPLEAHEPALRPAPASAVVQDAEPGTDPSLPDVDLLGEDGAPLPDPAEALGGPTDPEVEAALAEVLAHEDFGSTRTVRRWRTEGRSGDGSPDFGFLGPLLQILLVGVLVAAVIWILYLLILGASRRRRDERPERKAPTTAFGLEITTESLPDDPAAEARARLLAGDGRGCLSLLYRGAIAILVERDGLSLEESDTEHDCLRRVHARSAPPVAACFDALTAAWIGCAYGREDLERERGLELCERWAAVFGGSRHGGVRPTAARAGAPVAAQGGADLDGAPGEDDAPEARR